MIEARAIKNDDGTFSVVDMNGKPLKWTWKICGREIEFKCSQHLELYSLTDLKCYGINIINLNEVC